MFESLNSVLDKLVMQRVVKRFFNNFFGSHQSQLHNFFTDPCPGGLAFHKDFHLALFNDLFRFFMGFCDNLFGLPVGADYRTLLDLDG